MINLSYLDGENLSLSLLRAIFELINFKNSTFNNEPCFNNELEYLIENSIITKVSDKKFKIHGFIQNDLLETIRISSIYKTKIMNLNVKALNNLLENEKLFSDDEIETFYKQVNKIKGIDWFLKERNEEYNELLIKYKRIEDYYFSTSLKFSKREYQTDINQILNDHYVNQSVELKKVIDELNKLQD